MRFAKWVFAAAAVWGFLCLTPILFVEPIMSRQTGPLTYPEYFYGFLGVALVFQGVFAAIARDPVRLRPIMPFCVLEKFVWGVTAWVLHAQGRTPMPVVGFATLDMAIGAMFVWAYLRTPKT